MKNKINVDVGTWCSDDIKAANVLVSVLNVDLAHLEDIEKIKHCVNKYFTHTNVNIKNLNSILDIKFKSNVKRLLVAEQKKHISNDSRLPEKVKNTLLNCINTLYKKTDTPTKSQIKKQNEINRINS
jgi:hypothetical protein